MKNEETGSSYLIGVDIGRTTHVALVDQAGAICQQNRFPTEIKSGRTLVNGLISAIRSIKNSALHPIIGIGVGIPGLVEQQTQKVEVLTNFVNISTVDLYGEVQRALNLPVIFDNDANMEAYGEWKCGVLRGKCHAVYITLGRGIGSALILNGQLQRGARGFSGELGHLKIGSEALECSCGSSGCLETVASGPNIVRRTRELFFTDSQFTTSSLVEKMKGRLTLEDVVAASIKGDALARSVLLETARFLGIAVGNVVNLLNVEMVVLGGPVMAAGEVLLGAIREEVAQQAFAPLFANCAIVMTQMGTDAGVIGAALMARDFAHL